jgi:putative membrane protein insertion efficiency factor
MKIVSLLVLGLIRGYQLLISPFFPPSCRFFPSCSEYAHQAVVSHGPLQGGWLALTRLLRCHPWGGLGYDPVPEKSPASKIAAGLGLCQDCRHVDHQAGR